MCVIFKIIHLIDSKSSSSNSKFFSKKMIKSMLNAENEKQEDEEDEEKNCQPCKNAEKTNTSANREDRTRSSSRVSNPQCRADTGSNRLSYKSRFGKVGWAAIEHEINNIDQPILPILRYGSRAWSLTNRTYKLSKE
ncbi:unnamed protein product [Caenorhabditis angaria]|uniref:Uncharacterized protein n=1 Tax=Caenorhabditis angaria TaxID=860376 RepID=A0A9P1N915_9PELO|nr:unnamed protein product [Caenorhabditis angaria]